MEYTYYHFSPTKHRDGKPRFVGSSSLPDHGYCSLYAVSKADAEAIEQSGTTRQFKGVVHNERLWIDIDSYEKADVVEERLNVLKLDYVAYDSGGRGAHFGIRRIHRPSHLLPLVDKAYVQEYFPEADTSIYSHLHLFRNIGARHEKTGRSKQFVCRQLGEALKLEGFPIKEQTYVGQDGQLVAGAGSIFDSFPVLCNLVPAENGGRHKRLVGLAYALKNSGCSGAVAEFLLGEVNKTFNEQKPLAEISKIVSDIFR